MRGPTSSDALAVDAARLIGTQACMTLAPPSGRGPYVRGHASRFRQAGAGSAGAASATSYAAEVVRRL